MLKLAKTAKGPKYLYCIAESRDSYIPIVSIVFPFGGLPFRKLNIDLVKPKKGTTMETIGRY